MKKHKLADLKPGDRVVMKRVVAGGKSKDAGIRTVARLTPTQIILEDVPLAARYQRCEEGRGFIGRNLYTHSVWIDRIATAKDIVKWEVEQAAQTAERDHEAKIRYALLQKRAELWRLLRERASVSLAGRSTKDTEDTWDVEFTGLTEAQVRKLAKVKL